MQAYGVRSSTSSIRYTYVRTCSFHTCEREGLGDDRFVTFLHIMGDGQGWTSTHTIRNKSRKNTWILKPASGHQDLRDFLRRIARVRMQVPEKYCSHIHILCSHISTRFLSHPRHRQKNGVPLAAAVFHSLQRPVDANSYRTSTFPAPFLIS